MSPWEAAGGRAATAGAQTSGRPWQQSRIRKAIRSGQRRVGGAVDDRAALAPGARPGRRGSVPSGGGTRLRPDTPTASASTPEAMPVRPGGHERAHQAQAMFLARGPRTRRGLARSSIIDYNHLNDSLNVEESCILGQARTALHRWHAEPERRRTSWCRRRASVQAATPFTHAPRFLILYGSLRERSFSRFLAYEAARLLEAMGGEVRIYDAHGLPLPDDATADHPKVQELREPLDLVRGAGLGQRPSATAAMTGVMKSQIDWLPAVARARSGRRRGGRWP